MKKYLLMNKWENIINLLGIILVSLLSVTTAVLLTFSTNAIFKGNINLFIKWSTINLIAWLLLVIASHYQTVYQEKLIQKMNNQIREKLSCHIKNVAYSEYHKLTDGQYISRYTSDINTIENSGFKNFYSLVSSILNIIFSSVALLAYHYILLIVIIILALIMIFLPSIFSGSLQKITILMSQENENYTSKIKDILGGFDVFFYAGRQIKIVSLIRQQSQAYANQKIAYVRRNSSISGVIGFLNIASQMSVDLTTGFLAIIGVVEFGAISTTGNLASTIFNSLANLSNQIMQVKSTAAIFDKFKFEEKYTEKEVVNNMVFSSKIEIKNLSYSYGKKDVLKKVNMTIEHGKKYALIGESGSGKSTLLKILAGQITDYTGNIYIDGENIKELQKKALTSNIQYIDQTVYLFNDSIKNNLTLWNEVGTEKIKQVIKKAKIDFIESINDFVSENGRNFSGGQKQRMALARGFLEEKKIILMDEGTSSLDEETASVIENSLLEDKSSTLLMVTHKLNDLSKVNFDSILNINELQ